MKTDTGNEKRGPLELILVFVVLTVAAISIASLYYRQYEREFRVEVERQLSSIAELKVSEIVQWRKERLADASVYYGNTAFADLVQGEFSDPPDALAQAQLEQWLRLDQEQHEYERVFLLDARGEERFSVPAAAQPADVSLDHTVADVVQSGQITFVDFYRSSYDQRIYLTILIPIFADGDSRRVIAVLALRIDPEQYLYPLINLWPTPSQTAETLIVRRDGNDVLFLNELKFQKDTALAFRSSLQNTRMPAVMAALGKTGIVDGIDYRGVAVLADLRGIPDSPWFMVARMDMAEVYAPARERLWQIIAFVALIIFGAGAGVGAIWRQQRALYYRRNLETLTALHLMSSRQEALLAAVPDIIMEVDNNRVYTWASEAGLAFFGDDVIGKEAAFYFAGQQDTLKTVQPLFDSQEGTVYLESWQRRRDGRKRLLAWSWRTLRDEKGNAMGALSSARDITEQKQAQVDLRDSEALFRMAVQESRFPIIIHAEDGEVLQINRAWSEITGYAYADIPTIPDWTERAFGQRKDIVRADIDRLYEMDKGKSEGEYVITCKDGSQRVWDFASVPLRQLPDGRRLVMSMAADITDHKRAEQELQMLNADLEQRVLRRTTQLEASNKELESFAYSVSHDLRSPLRAIDGFSRIIQEEYSAALDAEGNRLLNVVRKSAQQMDRLITDLLALSRVTRTSMTAVRIDMADLARSVYDELLSREVSDACALTVTTLPEAEGDPTLLRQVWTNLLANAIKFTRPRDKRKIEVGGYTDNGTVVYFVKDNGVGFNPAYTHKLFGAFQRLHKAAEFEGTGVGLAIVQRIVHRHGGRVWAEGEVDGGATFYFALPANSLGGKEEATDVQS